MTRQHNGQKKKDKQRSTKHYTENWRSRNAFPIIKKEENPIKQPLKENNKKLMVFCLVL
jgi:hypothetical protein